MAEDEKPADEASESEIEKEAKAVPEGKTSLLANPLVQMGILGFLALATAASLTGGDWVTRDAIAQRRAEDMQSSLRQVVPDELHDNDLLADTVAIPVADGAPITVYRGRRNGKVSAVAFGMTTKGYSGDISLVIGVDPSGTVLGVRVLAHTETPGLGDKIDVAKTSWVNAFAGLALGKPPEEKWKVKKDGGIFDQFSGATITPRAVVKGVKEGLAFFQANRDSILRDAAPAGKKE